MDRSTLGSTHHQSGKFFQNESFQTISILFTSTKIFEHFRKSILSKQSKTSLEQNKLRNADILIQQETIRTNSSSQVTTPSLFDLHEIYRQIDIDIILYFVKKCKKNVSLFHWRYILVSQNLRSTLAMARVQDAVFLSRWQNLNEKTVDMKIETLRENVKMLNVR